MRQVVGIDLGTTSSRVALMQEGLLAMPSRSMPRAVGRPVDVHVYAERIVIRQDGVIVGEHARRFGQHQTVYDPWHYVRHHLPVAFRGSR